MARWYCPEAHATISLLPDFFASRMPGTLDEIEQTVARAEELESVERTAEAVRPADAPKAVTLPTAVRWVRLRVRLVTMMLVAALGLFPERFAPGLPTVGYVRQKLGTTRALVALRRLAEGHLHALRRPLGLVPPSAGCKVRDGPTNNPLGSTGEESPGTP